MVLSPDARALLEELHEIARGGALAYVRRIAESGELERHLRSGSPAVADQGWAWFTAENVVAHLREAPFGLQQELDAWGRDHGADPPMGQYWQAYAEAFDAEVTRLGHRPVPYRSSRP